jgi:hypothetical protein
MVARISIQFATKSSIVTIASLPRMLFAKHMRTMNAVEAVKAGIRVPPHASYNAGFRVLFGALMDSGAE